MPSPLTFYPDGWAFLKRLILWPEQGNTEGVQFMSGPFWGHNVWRDICVCRQECKAVLIISCIPTHKVLTPTGSQEGDALAVDSLVREADLVHRKSGLCCIQVGWHTVKDARFPLKYSNVVNGVIACHVCSKQRPRQQPKESGAIHQSSQLMKYRPTNYIGPLLPSECFRYVLVCVDA